MDFPLNLDRLAVLTSPQIEKTCSLGVEVPGMLSHFPARTATLGYLFLCTRHHSRGSNFRLTIDSVHIKYDKTSCVAWTFAFSLVDMVDW